MKRQILISSLILLSIQTFVSAKTIFVPSRDYPTIQSGIDGAVNGDVVVVAPGVYTGPGNVNLDFSHGLTAPNTRAITVRSMINPDSPSQAIIDSTIIDCGGNPTLPLTNSNEPGGGAANRAFWFHSAETSGSKVMGFTIRNGYARGPKGMDGDDRLHSPYIGRPVSVGFERLFFPIPGDDPNSMPPYALDGNSVTGDGYGGAILCQGSSPTIRYCVIENCTVTGAQGGRGDDGLDGPWSHFVLADIDPCTGDIGANATPTENPDGQWAGWGGWGTGTGYGGAFACLANSDPCILDCTIRNNIARGGVGGEGGNGGDAADNGAASFGGNAGFSLGAGKGGVLYAEKGSNPIIKNCTFSNNAAATGIQAAGGSLGQGDEIPADEGGPATDGFDGVVISDGNVAGGVAYYNLASAYFTNCTFTGNKAYENFINPYYPNINLYYPSLVLRYPDISHHYLNLLYPDSLAYTVGGALYSDWANIVTLNSCDFTDNLGGAVYCGAQSIVNIGNSYDPGRMCLFTNNSDPDDGSDLAIDNGIDFGSGGAVYIGPSAPLKVNIQSCVFAGNSAKNDGGALKCESNTNITNCSFGGNLAGGYGGAVDAYHLSTNLTIDVNTCSFSQNQALSGGAFSSENLLNTKFTNCYFVGNTARNGGGLDLAYGNFSVKGGIITGNKATNGSGGGLDCWYTSADISNCTISNNSADGVYPAGGSGGAVNLYGLASAQKIFNCLIAGNSADVDGGAIFCSDTTPDIGNCTFSGNLAGRYGGAIYSDFISEPNITDCIFEGCSNHAIHEEDLGGDAIVKYSLFYNNPNGDYYDSGTELVYTGAGQVGSIPGGADNLYGNPLFAVGPFGNYYLSQILAGQASNSPALDNGSDTAANLTLDALTTRTDNVADAGQVDRGYHYPDGKGVARFQLTASVTGGYGSVSPADGNYAAGAVVTLTATPAPNWRVKSWSGTDNDYSSAATNTVIMNTNRTVGVEFEQPRTLNVPVDYPTLQAAIDAAGSGDTIILAPAPEPYRTSYPYVIIGEDIVIAGANPDDPNVVANTVIEWIIGEEGYTDVTCFYFQNVGPNTVLNGLTIRGFNVLGYNGLPGDPELFGYDGRDGEDMYGGAIICNSASPTIKNCIIEDCSVTGGTGGVGYAGEDDHPDGGHGGWPGKAYGGGLACMNNSSPSVINCTFDNCRAIGGNGGDGAQGNTNDGFYGDGGRGGGWYYTSPPHTAYEQGPYDFYTEYSAYGGAVYVDASCSPRFVNCTFSNNSVEGGVCGIHGQDGWPPEDRPQPSLNWKIDSFGGAVYCDVGSSVDFINCEFNNNIADLNIPPDNDDSFAGFGGAVAFEYTADFTFENCSFNGNSATIGGGMYWGWSDPQIDNCNFVGNSAIHGGGLFGKHSMATIFRSNFTGNLASSDDPNVLGMGGGLHFWATDVDIIDCNISGNQADSSGGGLYLGGEGTPLLNNCLFTNNTAGRDGGGVSANIFASPTVSNCTIAGNVVTGNGLGIGYGGGVYCSSDSYINMINSIIWDNFAQSGPQIAIGTGFEYNPKPSIVDVSYSDIQGGQSYVSIDQGCTLNWIAGNFNINPLFVTGPLGSYYLSQIAAGEATDSNCVGTGSASASSLGMDGYTTRTDERPDRKIVDLGYHYPFTPDAQPCRFCELVRDGVINYDDFAIFALNWLSEDCSWDNEWCQHADVTLDTYVGFEDLMLFFECWLAEDTYPPAPNPSEWEIVPHSSWSPEHPNSISMAAQIATDAWDFWVGNVQYYFDCVSGDCNDSGWQDEPNYIDPNLVVGVEYGYRVRVRDAGEQTPAGDTEPGNKTDWSSIRYAIVGGEPPPPEDHNPPTPNPMTWQTAPYATSPTSIAMVATTATDDTAGVEYYFEDSDNPAFNSGWQASPAWQDTACDPNTTYNYRVMARDTSAWHNQTGWSTVLGATTPAEGAEPNVPPPPDTTAPTPVQWEEVPYETGGGLTAYANMTAAEATDAGGNGVLYYFECTSIPSINSGWIAERVWEDVYIGRENQFLYFHFRVRDNLGNTSGWSTSLPCY
ncbi:MAG: right-handed parallel beta-helix repeat-containing protein [Phycisphaerae bacterium]